MSQPDHTFELPVDPHEDWYFGHPLPPNWRQMSAAEKRECWEAMDVADKADVAARMRHRRAVAAGMELAKRESEAEAAMWLGAAVDEALDEIANRTHPFYLEE